MPLRPSRLMWLNAVSVPEIKIIMGKSLVHQMFIGNEVLGL